MIDPQRSVSGIRSFVLPRQSRPRSTKLLPDEVFLFCERLFGDFHDWITTDSLDRLSNIIGPDNVSRFFLIQSLTFSDACPHSIFRVVLVSHRALPCRASRSGFDSIPTRYSRNECVVGVRRRIYLRNSSSIGAEFQFRMVQGVESRRMHPEDVKRISEHSFHPGAVSSEVRMSHRFTWTCLTSYK